MSQTTLHRDQASDRFALSIGGKVYGPYTAQQMKSYVAEGRITASSLVSRDGGAWMPANEDPLCAEWLAAPAAVQASASTPWSPAPSEAAASAPPRTSRPGYSPRPGSTSARDAFLKELEGVRLKSASFAEKQEPRGPAPAPPRTPVKIEPPHHDDPISPPATEEQSANLVLVFDLKSRGHGRLEEEIMSLGPATKVMSGLWLLHTDISSGAVRNVLMKHFGAHDTLFIVDATRGKSTWFNLGPEIDAQIRRVWRRT